MPLPLPNELLAQLFELYVRDAADAIRISHLDRTLRAIALTLPTIWRRIHIDSSRASTLHLAKLFLGRVKSNVTLSLAIKPCSEKHLRDVMEFIEFSGPWLRHLSIISRNSPRTRESDGIATLLESINTPNLHRLDINSDQHHYHPFQLSSWSCLQELRIVGPLLGISSAPYANLTSLCLNRIQPGPSETNASYRSRWRYAFFTILAEAKQLRQLELRSIDPDMPEKWVQTGPNPRRVGLPELVKLIIAECTWRAAEGFLSRLDAPVLDEVELVLNEDPWSTEGYAASPFFSVTICRIITPITDPSCLKPMGRLVRLFPNTQSLQIPLAGAFVLLDEDPNIGENVLHLSIGVSPWCRWNEPNEKPPETCIEEYEVLQLVKGKPLKSLVRGYNSGGRVWHDIGSSASNQGRQHW